jgi:DNA (cytosine-5)-methyltransferase 1
VRYLSVCSGIEAASVAWESLGWTPVAFAEIEKFPSKVLAHHYPGVANLGDMTRFREWDIERDAVDVLVGGTPCQSFSVAGLRKGLDDPRGNLALTFIAMVDHYRPEWVIWENVPGVLSSSGGRDFGSFLGALGNIGYGFAYRVLDAQYFGVPQRRRRVFVVAHSSGDSRRAAEVLFEPESLRGDTPKSNRTGKETSYSFTASLGIGSAKVSGTLCALDGPNGVSDQYANEAKLIVMADGQTNAAISTNEIAPTLNSSQENPIVAYNTLVSETSHCVLASGGQRNDPHTETMVPVTYRKSRRAQSAEDFETWVPDEVTNTLNCFDLGDIRSVDLVACNRVRRLTPIECERLQGFPDGYTDIMPETPDGPRYKALGNSMAVPVMRWIGSRIALATK